MTPVSTPSSTGSTSLVPRVFITRNVNCSSRSCILKKSYAQKLVLPLSTSLRLFPSIRTCILHRNPRTQIISSAAGTEVAVEETDSPVVDKDAEKPVSTPAVQPRRSGQGRRSEMPPVKNEDLVSGASFTGKVRSIQPFGAFIDFGAFTDGLVHVSQLSNSFVKDVNSVVSIGQEVTVRLVDVNFETGRISLSMKDEDDTSRSAEDNSDRPPRTPRKTGQKSGGQKSGGQRREKQSNFVKGQLLEGTVKSVTRSGAFITLPEGEEGFLPSSEEADSGLGSMMLGSGSSLEVGQEVSVWVLKIARGVTLTMKKESEDDSDDLTTEGTIYTATNPFLLAFRQNQEIATFLDEREKELQPASNDNVAPIAVADQKTVEAESAVDIENDGVQVEETPSVENVTAVDVIEEEADSTAEIKSEGEEKDETPSVENVVEVDVKTEEVDSTVEIESAVEEETPSVETVAAVDQKTEEADSTVEIESQEAETEVPTVENVAEVDEKIQEAESTVEIETEVTSEIPSLAPEDSKITSLSEETAVEENQISEVVENQIEVKEDVPSETPQVAENGNVAPVSEQPPEEKPAKATISPALVKQLREETGAGMMDCKNALSASDGDIVKAQEYLRKKGLASADKKSSRVTAEGRIGSYIHDSRIGVLIEVNCETDFVSRGDIFKGLVEDLAMQVAACPQVQYLTTDDVAVDFVEKEKAIEMQKEDLLSKPEQIREKIVEGRIRKRVEELALLEQAYIKNDKVTIKDWVKQNIATIGENIKVKRFVRFNLGEGLEKKSQDFAAEVAAQTTAKAPVVKEAAPVVEEVVEKAPTIAISAALVKQLREETGAGMMDCKKALAETSGDLEKAQEYLRKKGLSAADKKSSRLAAEGRVGSYIHDARIGVLIEVNCETDFVGRSEKFKELVDDLAMQVAACPSVKFVSIEDIPESVRTNEKSMEMEREDILTKPENMRERIAEGRVSKRLGEMALLEQKYIKDDSVLVKDLVKSTVAALGENIKVRRFARFTLGEDI